MTAARRLAAILAADVVGYSRVMDEKKPRTSARAADNGGARAASSLLGCF
jgi:class 3 adenylate cyclase